MVPKSFWDDGKTKAKARSNAEEDMFWGCGA